MRRHPHRLLAGIPSYSFRMSKRACASVLVGCVAVGLSGCASVPTASVPLERGEVQIDESALPPAALASLRERAGGLAFSGFQREDRVTYESFEAEWMSGNVEVEATVLRDGGVLEEEHELEPKDEHTLPPAIRERVRALRAQGFEVSVARRVVYLFDLDLSRGGNGSQTPPEEREMLLRPDGSDATRPPR
jgi:hypothetical protein